MPRLSDEQLEVLWLKTSGDARHWNNAAARARLRGNPEPPVPLVYVDARTLNHVVEELRTRRQRSSGRRGALKKSPITEQIITMKVGDVIEVPPCTHGQLTAFYRTARKHLEIADACWQSRTLPSGNMQITRLPNGSSPYARTNPIAVRMAQMKVGETIRVPSPITHVFRVHARNAMNNPAAQWSSVNLASGNTKITRTA